MPVKLAAIAAIVLGICAGLVFFTMGDRPKADDSRALAAEASGAAAPAEGFFKAASRDQVSQEPFVDGEGREVRLADYKGKVVLLNFWATWCAPCVKELPSLARLQAKQGDDGLVVMAVNLDRKKGDLSIEDALKEYGADTLEPYADANQKLMRAFRIAGLPTTILIDREGREIGRREGEAEWDSAEAIAAIEQAAAQ